MQNQIRSTTEIQRQLHCPVSEVYVKLLRNRGLQKLNCLLISMCKENDFYVYYVSPDEFCFSVFLFCRY